MTSDTTTDSTAGRREWTGLAVLALPALLASLELTVTHLALPSIGADLGATSTEQLWIVDVYAFLLAGSLITVGGLGDRIGRRRLLLIGAAAYGVLSILAAFAPSAELLIVARAGLGVAGATLMPSALALIATMFRRPAQRTVAISVLVSCVSGGTAIGPLVGGWLLDQYWWGSVFLIGVPFMVVLLGAGPRLLPENAGRQGVPLDITSAVLSMFAVLATVYGLKRIAVEGPPWISIPSVLVGLLLAMVFVLRQRRVDHPLVQLDMFGNRAFRAAAATLALGIFALWATNFAVAQYLQLVQGLDPLSAGFWTAPSAVGVIAGSTLAPRLARRTHPETVISAGLVISAIGFAILARVDSLPVMLVGTIVVSAGLGPMMALATDLVIQAAPPEEASMASAISSTAPQLGGAFGIAVLGSVIAAVYRREMSAADAPDHARDNLSATVVEADRLPAGVLDSALQAFTHGFQLIAAINGIIMLVLSVALLRGRPKSVMTPD